MTEHKGLNVQTSQNQEYDCFDGCSAIYDFMKLTDEMTSTIINLEEELVRWRQALIKYLPEEWANGLQQDILCDLSRDFEGDPAYDMYVNWMNGGYDPQQDQERIDRLYRIAKGIDETTINYL